MGLILIAAITLVLAALFLAERELDVRHLKDPSAGSIFAAMILPLTAMITEHLLVNPPPSALTFGGLLLFTVGAAVRFIGRKTLSRFFTYAIAVKKDHQLVTHGIYKHIRHPLYTGIFLLWFGAAMALQSFFGFLLTLALLVPALAVRIKKEEAFLVQQFGDEYKAYMKRTKRLVPLLY